MPLTFLTPWFAVAGLFAAAVVVAAHFIAARTRAPVPLPTTRFVPRLQERSAAMERRPRDMLLMLLRAAALAVTGVALAAPVSRPPEREPVKIVIADVAGSGGAGDVFDRAREAAGDNGRIVISDTGVSVINPSQAGFTGAPEADAASLTTAIVQAIRDAATLGAEGHPVQLAIVSAFRQRSIDSATAAVRSLWPGSVDLIRLSGDKVPPVRGPVTLQGNADDPLRATVDLLPSGSGMAAVIVRGQWSAADSATAVAGSVVVHWPRAGVPDSFTAAGSDTVGGVWVAGYTLVAPLPRNAVFSGNNDARVIARWIDGSPAAAEWQHGEGCIRRVAIAVPDVGDLSISPGFRRIAAALTAPCGGARPQPPLGESELAAFRGSGPRQTTLRSASASFAHSTLTVPLLLLAVLCVLVELAVRRLRR